MKRAIFSLDSYTVYNGNGICTYPSVSCVHHLYSYQLSSCFFPKCIARKNSLLFLHLNLYCVVIRNWKRRKSIEIREKKTSHIFIWENSPSKQWKDLPKCISSRQEQTQSFCQSWDFQSKALSSHGCDWGFSYAQWEGPR